MPVIATDRAPRQAHGHLLKELNEAKSQFDLAFHPLTFRVQIAKRCQTSSPAMLPKGV